MSTEHDDIGLITEPVNRLVQVLREKITGIGNNDYNQITVSAADGTITPGVVEQLGAKSPHMFVSLVGFGGFDGHCIDVHDFTVNVEITMFGGGCGGKTKHQWAKIMMTLATKIIIKYAGEADLLIAKDTITGISLDSTETRLQGFGVWQIAFSAQDQLNTSDV